MLSKQPFPTMVASRHEPPFTSAFWQMTRIARTLRRWNLFPRNAIPGFLGFLNGHGEQAGSCTTPLN